MGEIKTVEDVKCYAFYQLSMDRDNMIGPYICDVIFTMNLFLTSKALKSENLVEQFRQKCERERSVGVRVSNII